MLSFSIPDCIFSPMQMSPQFLLTVTEVWDSFHVWMVKPATHIKTYVMVMPDVQLITEMRWDVSSSLHQV